MITRRLMVFALLALSACDRRPVPQIGEPVLPGDVTLRITETRARELFEQEVVKPLKDWRFTPDEQRYFLARRNPQETRTSFVVLRSYVVTDLACIVAKSHSINIPFTARVTFSSTYEIEGVTQNEQVAAHMHSHTYQLVKGHWRLETQSYAIGAMWYECLIGHQGAQTSRVEALCVDEASRMVPAE